MAGPAPAHLKKVAALALAAMWLCEEVRLVAGWGLAAWTGAAAFLAYFVVALVLSRPAQRWIIAAISAAAVAAALHFSVPAALAKGVESAVLFAAFLAAMQMLRG